MIDEAYTGNISDIDRIERLVASACKTACRLSLIY